MRCLAAALLCLVSFTAQAKQSPYPSVTPFNGDRYAGHAQMGPDVVKAIGCPPPACQRAGKARHLYPTRKRPPVTRQRWRQVPIFAPLAGAVEPLSLADGVKREAGRVAVQIVGGRPSGCPSRFCACALALKIFGRIMPGLNVAVTWAHKFPRVAPAPTMVAARHGHAFQLIAHVRGSVWRVWDANSGHGRTRIHERSIAGFTIVNPHGSG